MYPDLEHLRIPYSSMCADSPPTPELGIAARIPKCPDCGYSWEGLPNSGTCPECGTRFDDGSNIWMLVEPNPRS